MESIRHASEAALTTTPETGMAPPDSNQLPALQQETSMMGLVSPVIDRQNKTQHAPTRAADGMASIPPTSMGHQPETGIGIRPGKTGLRIDPDFPR